MKNFNALLSMAMITVGASSYKELLANSFCSHDGARSYIGDFNGDGHFDNVCHDKGRLYWWIDYGPQDGQTDWSGFSIWCSHNGSWILVTDCDRDGDDDLLCVDNRGNSWCDPQD